MAVTTMRIVLPPVMARDKSIMVSRRLCIWPMTWRRSIRWSLLMIPIVEHIRRRMTSRRRGCENDVQRGGLNFVYMICFQGGPT